MRNFYLYSKFRDWELDFSRVFIYSDPHFIGNGEDKDAVDTHNLFQYEDDEIQIANINKVCFKNDLLIFLGDMGALDKMYKLKCKNWILITGNHDRGNNYYLEHGFKEVFNGPLFISDKLLLSHEPIHDREDAPRWVNIHGHLHNMSEIDGKCIHKHYICISANLHEYKPICLQDLFVHKGEFSNLTEISLANINNIHRQTIDRATIRKQERSK